MLFQRNQNGLASTFKIELEVEVSSIKKLAVLNSDFGFLWIRPSQFSSSTVSYSLSHFEYR